MTAAKRKPSKRDKNGPGMSAIFYYYEISASGARIGIGSCGTCGCALIVTNEPDDDALQRHMKWHEAERVVPRARR